MMTKYTTCPLFAGKEVAKFSKIHYPKLVLEQLVANEGDVAMALRESFHRIDELLEDPVRKTALSCCGDRCSTSGRCVGRVETDRTL